MFEAPSRLDRTLPPPHNPSSHPKNNRNQPHQKQKRKRRANSHEDPSKIPKHLPRPKHLVHLARRCLARRHLVHILLPMIVLSKVERDGGAARSVWMKVQARPSKVPGGL